MFSNCEYYIIATYFGYSACRAVLMRATCGWSCFNLIPLLSTPRQARCVESHHEKRRERYAECNCVVEGVYYNQGLV